MGRPVAKEFLHSGPDFVCGQLLLDEQAHIRQVADPAVG